MGLKGPLPKIKAVPPEQLQDLSPPGHLSDEAQNYWNTHAKRLVRQNLLTKATKESWAVCCDCYGRLRDLDGQGTNRIYLDTLKAWQSLAKLFRLTPTEKPGETGTGRHDDAPQFQMEDHGE